MWELHTSLVLTVHWREHHLNHSGTGERSRWLEAGGVWVETPLLWKKRSTDLGRQPQSTTIKRQKNILAGLGGIVDPWPAIRNVMGREKKVSLLGAVCLFEGKRAISKHQCGLPLWISRLLGASPCFATKSPWPWASCLGSVFRATITAHCSEDLCFPVSCCSGFQTLTNKNLHS